MSETHGSDIAVLQNNQTIMAQDIRDIKETTKTILNKIDWFKDIFVTKVDHTEKHSENKKRIERIEYAVFLLLLSLSGYLITMAAAKIFQ